MGTFRIWPATNGPFTSANDGQPLNLATEFYVTQTCWATAVLFWRGDTNVLGPILGRLWRVDSGTTGSAVPGTDVTFVLNGTGWQTATFSAPVQLVANQRYRTGIVVPGNFSATAGYWNPGGAGETGFTNGALKAPSNGPNPDQSGTQGSFIAGATYTYPTSNFQGGNYWVDVTVTDVDPAIGGPKAAAFMSFFQ
jgi:hypothetical protein